MGGGAVSGEAAERPMEPEAVRAPLASLRFTAQFQGKKRSPVGFAKEAGSGGKGRDRTDDTRIFSPLLYQLSYLAEWHPQGESNSSYRHEKPVS